MVQSKLEKEKKIQQE